MSENTAGERHACNPRCGDGYHYIETVSEWPPSPATPDAGDVEVLAEALESLAPLVRQGLMGVNVPAGADLNPALCSTDPTVAAAKDEHVRRALSWVAHAHPNAVRTALDAVRCPKHCGRDSGAPMSETTDPTAGEPPTSDWLTAREAALARAWRGGWIVGNRWAFTDADADAIETNPYSLAPDTAGGEGR